MNTTGPHPLKQAPLAQEALANGFPGIRVDIDDSHEERDAVAAAVREGRADIGTAGKAWASPYFHGLRCFLSRTA